MLLMPGIRDRGEEIGVAGSAADIFRRAGVFAAKAKHRGICRRSRTHSRSCGTPCRAPCPGRRAVRPLARALQPIPGSVPRSAGLPNTHDAHAEKLIRNGGSVTCMTRQAAMYSRSRGSSHDRRRGRDQLRQVHAPGEIHALPRGQGLDDRAVRLRQRMSPPRTGRESIAGALIKRASKTNARNREPLAQ